MPDIVDVLGQRPYPLKATLLEYLQELRDRTVEEKAAEEVAKQAEAEAKKTEEEAVVSEKVAEEEKKEDQNLK